MNIDKVEQEKVNQAFSKLKEKGVQYAERTELYSCNTAGAYFIGKYVGNRKIETKYGERDILNFQVEEGVLGNINGELDNINNKLVGIFAPNDLFKKVCMEWDENSHIFVETKDTIGKTFAVVYVGDDEITIGKGKNKKNVTVSRYNVKVLN